ncbi:MAG: hypothetical protein Tsb0020_35300 [Haliangiales bacterium]
MGATSTTRTSTGAKLIITAPAKSRHTGDTENETRSLLMRPLSPLITNRAAQADLRLSAAARQCAGERFTPLAPERRLQI